LYFCIYSILHLRYIFLKKLFFTYIFLFLLTSISFSQEVINNPDPKFFLTINGTLGKHTINFKDFSKSSGLSFGFSVSAGIYAVHKGDYKGGLVFTLLEGASRDEDRREISEGFELPNAKFDKHIIFNFAQFRSGTIGWFQEVTITKNIDIYHQLGFGIFGTTEKDQLFDFGMSNQAGVLIGKPNAFKFRLGITYDNTFGTGNPNYTQNNLGFTIGGFRSF